MDNLQQIIETAFEERQSLDLGNPAPELREAILTAIEMLDSGQARVAEPTDEGWTVHQWIKKAVLLYFGIEQSRSIDGGYTNFFDKVPLKFDGMTQAEFERAGIRVVPSAVARKGAHIARDVVLMPSYVNIGAYIDSGTMVDTWATV
ncbi:MAG: 2,3,4,5-tetrahydropyridine-2,6-dicarboxylate N-succinyltransferase, partial [Gammaproteobacteria bacterium]|nr:2,3,4,5-tetrahydropyridine-2,6-dicarboxylate N-succinyltransferase [Gammaproteobacteria bacterium]